MSSVLGDLLLDPKGEQVLTDVRLRVSAHLVDAFDEAVG
jgi:hypothetical protein